MPSQKSLTKEAALQKLRHYCGYQERSHGDVKQKIFSLGVAKADREELLATLIEEGYLNELRFAIAFAGGKFRINGWGRIKIRHELKQHQVSEYCIKQALREIDESEYRKTLTKLLEAKWDSLRNEKSIPARTHKVMDYLLLKGFERETILPLLKERTSGKK